MAVGSSRSLIFPTQVRLFVCVCTYCLCVCICLYTHKCAICMYEDRAFVEGGSGGVCTTGERPKSDCPTQVRLCVYIYIVCVCIYIYIYIY